MWDDFGRAALEQAKPAFGEIRPAGTADVADSDWAQL
jgi:hypothetical protein